MSTPLTQLLPPIDISIKLAIAVGIGMLIGLEREWSQKDLGTRTFTIVAMSGTISVLAGPPFAYLAFAGVLLIVLLSGLRSIRERKAVEATTSVAVILTFILGVLAGQGHHYTPVASAIVMTMLLSLKPALTHFAGGLQVSEVRSAVLLGLLAFVVYPVLPDHPIDPWQLINPREDWLTIIIIAALGFLNYVLLKLYRSRGLYYTAVLGGMVNSTATIAELSGYLARSSVGDLTGTAIFFDLLTVVAMFVRNLVILVIFSRNAVVTAAGPLGVMAFISLLILWYRRSRASAPGIDLKLASPLALKRVVSLGLILIAVEIVGELVQRHFGHLGFLFVSIIGGFVSSASTTGAAAMLAMHGTITARTAGLATVLTSMASGLSNLPLIHQQIRNWRLSRTLAALSLFIIAAGVLTMALIWRVT
jgi:uncharacterized membrane protein (DUF4010 family)